MVSAELLFLYGKILMWFTFGLPRPIADLQFYISAVNSIVITLLWQLYPQKLIIPKDYIPMKLLSEYHATRVYWDWKLMSYYPCLFLPFPWRQKSDTLAGKQNIKLTFTDTSVRGAFSFSSFCQIDCERSFFFFRFSEGNCTRARAAKPRETRARVYLRVSRVLLDGPRKKRDC